VKRDVYLNNSAIITGLGSLDTTWHSLLNNQSSIMKKAHFENTLLPETGLALYKRDFSDFQTNFIPILMKECLAGFPKLPEDTFLIWTGIKNNGEKVESHYNGTPEPFYSSAHDLRCWLADILGLKNDGMEVNAACASSTIGCALAAQYIAEGRYDHILVAGADMVSRFVYYGFAALKAMKSEVCMPFDTQRSGLSLGDGAVALFLSAEPTDIRISGYGITNDANHITGPSRDGAGLAKALFQAIKMAELDPSSIQAFCAHGTGTRYNDTMELLAAQSVFGENVPLLFGVKGAIGHTLGAAGGIEIALCEKCLREEMIPPTVGCRLPESPGVVLEKTAFPGRNILTSNSGFGGINAAILMENLS
jgi:3-oxoacyl-[acyl-carrier-protein] synthase II